MSEAERKKLDVTDLQWDSGEDHLLVAFGNGKLAMVNFEGFSAEKTVWKHIYERQKQGVNAIAWAEDRSGDFMVTSKKVGIVKVFNVAVKAAKQIVKVGSLGVHFMKRLDAQRMVFALSNGAVQIFNFKKRKIEFQTEAGHAETVFDL